MRTATPAGPARGTNHGKNGKNRKKKRDKPFSVVPIFFGMAVAFVIGAFILVYLIFANSTNPLFSNRADVQLIDFVNMTESEFRASDYYTQLSPKWQYEYNSQYEGRGHLPAESARRAHRQGGPGRHAVCQHGAPLGHYSGHHHWYG